MRLESRRGVLLLNEHNKLGLGGWQILHKANAMQSDVVGIY